MVVVVGFLVVVVVAGPPAPAPPPLPAPGTLEPAPGTAGTAAFNTDVEAVVPVAAAFSKMTNIRNIKHQLLKGMLT